MSPPKHEGRAMRSRRSGCRLECRPERFEPHPGAQPLEGILLRIDQMRARRHHDQDFLGDGLEVGAEMAAALARQDLLVLRLDAAMAENVLIVGLHAPPGADDQDAADREHRRRADIAIASHYAPAWRTTPPFSWTRPRASA